MDALALEVLKGAITAITVEEVDKVSKFGKGTLDIKKHVLTPDAPCPDIE